jgi:hypothetical protein
MKIFFYKNDLKKMESMIKTISLILIFFMAGAFHKILAEDKNNNWKPAVIFLLGGQSNMDGRGITAEIPKEFLKYPSTVRIWSGANDWAEIKPGEMFGPEIGFAFEMSKKWPKVQIGLVKLGSSGTNMTYWAGKEAEPKPKKEGPNGSLYVIWIQMLKKALKSAPDAQFKGVLWMQGESDAQDQKLSENYESNLKKIIEGVREETENKNLPFLIGKIQAKDFKFLKAVWKAEEDVAKKIPNVDLVNTDAVELKPDKLHFTSKGQLELGKLFAEEFLKSTSKTKNAPKKK